jgi:hypothetical protein
MYAKFGFSHEISNGIILQYKMYLPIQLLDQAEILRGVLRHTVLPWIKM